MQEFTACIIGGGASGIMASISAKRAGHQCIILEKMPVIGKKVLASGNGRCNLLNEKLDESFYNPEARPLVRSVFTKFAKKDILDFFGSLGLNFKHESDRIFPATNQAATVLKVLNIEIKRLSIPIEFNFDVEKITENGGGFILRSKSGSKIACRKIILTGGGKSYPALGSDGNAYELARSLGHKIIDPVPVCVPLLTKDPALHHLQGQKISVNAKSIIGGNIREISAGELLITKYGLSGTAILDISESVSIAINRKHSSDVWVSIDTVPFMSETELERELSSRVNRGFPEEDLLAGILPNKFSGALKRVKAKALKDWRFKITGTRGWNEAEFTAGGVDAKEVRETTLESRIVKGLYFAGEILDVNGKRGGYNLAWAWSSGFVAGVSL